MKSLFSGAKRIISEIVRVLNPDVIKDILRNPEAHARELPVLLALLSILTLSIIIYYYIRVLRKTLVATPTEENIKKLSLYAAAAFAASIVMLYVPAAYVASSSSCLKCHNKEGNHYYPLDEIHQKVDCGECHTEKGFYGRMTSTLRLSNKIFALNVSKNIRIENSAPVSERNCIICHSDILDETINNGYIRVSHREIIEKFNRCKDCHVFDTLFAEFNTPTSVMEKCSRCHDGLRTSSDCQLCHTPFGRGKKYPPDLNDYPKVFDSTVSPVLDSTEPVPAINIQQP